MNTPFPTLCAADCMTSPAIVVGPDDPARHVVKLLVEHRISGLPVVDADGRPVGVVSEWDFVAADPARQERRREFWLQMLSGGQGMSEAYLATLDQDLGKVRQFMASPAVCVDERAPLSDVAALLRKRGIKRVAVTRDGRTAGVVTRADIMRALVGTERDSPPRADEPAVFAAALPLVAPRPVASPPPPHETTFSAEALRARVAAYEREIASARLYAADDARRAREAQVQVLLAAPLADAEWAAILADATAAAGRGETQCVVMLFPALLCADGGRRINLPDPDWPSALRGNAALFYLRWREELKPAGFRLNARIASFPDGLPGDVELILVWGR
jgi:CBS domain-containing protein